MLRTLDISGLTVRLKLIRERKLRQDVPEAINKRRHQYHFNSFIATELKLKFQTLQKLTDSKPGIFYRVSQKHFQEPVSERVTRF